MKQHLFILRQASYNGLKLQENLDIILTTAAFDQPVRILFLDDAVFALKNQQNPNKQNFKDTSAIFQALKIYDIHDLYCEQESLDTRGLKLQHLCLSVKLIKRHKINEFMQKHDIIISM